MPIAARDSRRLEGMSRDELDAFLEKNRFPLVEGRTATFVYRGEADSVHLRHWVFGLPSSQPFTRVKGTDVWHFAMEIPERSRIEYKIDVVSHGEHRWIRDPFNPNLAHDPFGANSVLHGAGYETPDWTRHDEEARQGELDVLVLESKALRDQRGVRVYLPARFRPTRRYPLLVVHDGEDYLRYARFKTVLDNLVHRLEIPPMIVALTNSPNRLHEYAAFNPHAKFVAEELVPALEARYPLDPRPQARGLMGASLGAVASLHTAVRYPNRFGRLLLQSGSFGFTDIGRNQRGPVFEPIVKWVNAFRDDPKRVSEKLFVSCGVYESLIYENRSLLPLLQGTGMDVRFVEARDGHNWENWRDRLREGLSWLFPGPLWMVYE